MASRRKRETTVKKIDRDYVNQNDNTDLDVSDNCGTAANREVEQTDYTEAERKEAEAERMASEENLERSNEQSLAEWSSGDPEGIVKDLSKTESDSCVDKEGDSEEGADVELDQGGSEEEDGGDGDGDDDATDVEYYEQSYAENGRQKNEDYDSASKSRFSVPINPHRQEQQQNETHVCPVCFDEFTFAPDLRHHLSADDCQPETDLDNFKCAICSVTFTAVEEFKSHSVQHLDKKLFSCMACGTLFSTKRDLDKHMFVDASILNQLRSSKELVTLPDLLCRTVVDILAESADVSDAAQKARTSRSSEDEVDDEEEEGDEEEEEDEDSEVDKNLRIKLKMKFPKKKNEDGVEDGDENEDEDIDDEDDDEIDDEINSDLMDQDESNLPSEIEQDLEEAEDNEEEEVSRIPHPFVSSSLTEETMDFDNDDSLASHSLNSTEGAIDMSTKIDASSRSRRKSKRPMQVQRSALPPKARKLEHSNMKVEMEGEDSSLADYENQNLHDQSLKQHRLSHAVHHHSVELATNMPDVETLTSIKSVQTFDDPEGTVVEILKTNYINDGNTNIIDNEDAETSDGEEFPNISEERVDGSSDDDISEFQPAALERAHQQFLASTAERPVQAEDDETLVVNDSTYNTKDELTWSSVPPEKNIHAKSRNIFKMPRTQTPNTATVSDPVDLYRLIVSDKIIEVIVKYTNLEGALRNGSWKETDATEIRCLVGSLLILGTLKQNMLGTDLIWDSFYGNPMVKSGLGRQRFVDLMTHLRFDEKETRSTRRAKDAFAPFRDVWDIFMKNLRCYYTPGPFLTVGEQLIPFRGRCSFLQHLPSKPGRHGIRVFWVADSYNSYPVYGIPYLSKEGTSRMQNLGQETAIQLVTPFFKSGRNVTCDNYFTDMELANTLLKNDVTCVGTVRQNKRFLPEDFKQKAGLRLHESKFAFRERCTLSYYQTKQQKSVVVLSTMHQVGAIDPASSKKKPEMVIFYNSTKGAVDTMDKMVRGFTTKRKTKRWPMQMLFNMLDVSTIAARCIWQLKFPDHPLSQKDRRSTFIRDVGENLMHEQLQRRVLNPFISAPLKTVIQSALGRLSESLKPQAKEFQKPQAKEFQKPQVIPRERKLAQTPQKMTKKQPTKPTTECGRQKQGRCGSCDWRSDAKTTGKCDRCQAWTCRRHARRLYLFSGGNPGSLICTMCGDRLADKQKLDLHIADHEKLFPYFCALCDANFMDGRLLKAHVASCHSASQSLQCPMCGMYFKLRGSLGTHMKFCRQAPACVVCGEHFSGGPELEKHYYNHSLEERAAAEFLSCNDCGEVFVSTLQLRQHQKAHGAQRPFTCQVCGGTFTQQKNLDKHRQVHLRRQDCKCQICGVQLLTRSGYIAHLRGHKNNDMLQVDLSTKLLAMLEESSGRKHTRKDGKKAKRNFVEEEEEEEDYAESEKADEGAEEEPKRDLTLDTEEYLKLIEDQLSSLESASMKGGAKGGGGKATKAAPKPRLHSCPFCDMVFPSADRFQNHVRRSHRDQAHFDECEVCQRQIYGKEYLERHRRTHSNNTERFPCDQCSKVFRRKWSLETHRKIHTFKKFVRCDICGEEFRFISEVDKHKHRVHQYDRTQSVFQCNVCGMKFSTLSHLSIHSSHSHKPSDGKPFRCEKCLAVFATCTDLKKHIYRSHESIPCVARSNVKQEPHDPDFEDTLSDKVKSYVKKLVQNLPADGGNGRGSQIKREPLDDTADMDGEDEEEGEAVNTYNENTRQRMSQSNMPRRFVCETCQKCFATKSDLRTHIRTHTGETPYKCEFCDRAFKQRGHRKLHIQVTHTKVMPYTCDQCGQSYPTRYRYQIHVKRHSGIRDSQCNYCDKAYYTVGKLNEHKRKHHPQEFAREQVEKAKEAA